MAFTLTDLASAYANSENRNAVKGFYRDRALNELPFAKPDQILAAIACGLLTDDDIGTAPAAPAAPVKGKGKGKSAPAPAAPAPKAKTKAPTKRERLGITGKGFEVAYDAEVSAKCNGTPMFALYLDGVSLKCVSARVVAGIVAAGPAGLASMETALQSRGLLDKSEAA